MNTRLLPYCVAWLLLVAYAAAAELPVVTVEGQPLAANVRRVVQALEMLGQPLPEDVSAKLEAAAKERDQAILQATLDKHVLLAVAINPESRVKVLRGPAEARLQQGGYLPVIVKVVNEGAITTRLKIVSPQAGPVYAGFHPGSLERQQQTELGQNPNAKDDPERFLGVEMFAGPPLTDKLSGLAVEYMLALLYSHETGKREATIGFDVEQGNQDLGFRGETAVLFDVQPAVAVKLNIADEGGQPTIARLLIRDANGRVYPPQAKRVAPDLFFQPHIYRNDGETVVLPPGKFTVEYSRGPEYRVLKKEFEVPQNRPLTPSGPDAPSNADRAPVPHEVRGRLSGQSLDLKLARWIDPAAFGFYSGDHHIHAAGCAHYTVPTEGIEPADMFRQVKGEGLNVGCVLTWGPCYRHQRQFFLPKPHDLSQPLTLLKYDLEISGFGSQALGHVCLLNLKDQTYPGSEGTETKGWPSWATPVMRWCKEQGGVTGYAHSASGLWIDEKSASERMLARYDASKDGELSADEVAAALLPEPFVRIDADRSRQLNLTELMASHARAAEQLPNLAIPEMNGAGAMELPVSVAEGVCDFISAMDTRRIQEWNTWYHVLNCGFPLKASGETDFPCMSSRQVGQGRIYVRLDDVQASGRREPPGTLPSPLAGEGPGARGPLDYTAWCEGIRAGRSYVSDGYAHAVEFQVNDVRPGDGDVKLAAPDKVTITAKVAFAAETPLAVAHGGITPPAGKSVVGDTVVLHGPRRDEMLTGGKRKVEIVVNGQPVASQEIEADGELHELQFEAPIERSSWVALRHFPQLHTNPVNVLITEQPIRASKESARWCIEAIDLLWTNRERAIKPEERAEAKATFERAKERYRRIGEEAGE